MKKTIAILLAVLMTCSLLAFAGCGSKPAGGEKTSKPDTATTAPGDKPSEAADTTSAQLIADEVASPLQEWVDGDVTYNYCTMNTPDGTMGYFLITSEKDEEIGIELKLTPKDASGAVVGDDDLTFTISTIAPGTTIHVDDPDGILLNPANQRTFKPVSATAISGPAALTIDNLDAPWYASVNGSTFQFGYRNGTMMIFR